MPLRFAWVALCLGSAQWVGQSSGARRTGWRKIPGAAGANWTASRSSLVLLMSRSAPPPAPALANTAWLVVPQSLVGVLRIPSNCTGGGVPRSSICGQPAAPGDVLQVFVTGLGRATAGGNPGAPALATGQVAPASGSPLYATIDPPTVTIGQFPAEVLFSGLAPGLCRPVSDRCSSASGRAGRGRGRTTYCHS
jgi:hypothetical protein